MFTLDQETGTLMFRTKNVNYDGYVLQVTLMAEIEENGERQEYYFTISIFNACYYIDVLPPEAIDIPPFEFRLWEQSSYDFTYA